MNIKKAWNTYRSRVRARQIESEINHLNQTIALSRAKRSRHMMGILMEDVKIMNAASEISKLRDEGYRLNMGEDK